MDGEKVGLTLSLNYEIHVTGNTSTSYWSEVPDRKGRSAEDHADRRPAARPAVHGDGGSPRVPLPVWSHATV